MKNILTTAILLTMFISFEVAAQCDIIDSRGELLVATTSELNLGRANAASSNQDSDGDGVLDAQDACDMIAGTIDSFGCPADNDGDGVYDTEDTCPSEAGMAKDNGCPTLNEEEKELLKKPLKE